MPHFVLFQDTEFVEIREFDRRPADIIHKGFYWYPLGSDIETDDVNLIGTWNINKFASKYIPVYIEPEKLHITKLTLWNRLTEEEFEVFHEKLEMKSAKVYRLILDNMEYIKGQDLYNEIYNILLEFLDEERVNTIMEPEY